MKKITVVQLTLLILVSGVGGGIILYTDVYDDIQSSIVTTLCFGCIKMDPVTHLNYTFETANDQPHPQFVLDNLTTGPIFLAFSEDGCEPCNETKSIIQDVFNVHFKSEELFYKTVDYSGSTVHFIHINRDHSPVKMKDSLYIYDQDNRGGVPMFVMITLGNNSGQINPYYTTAYGKFGLQSDSGQKAFLRKMITRGIDLYNRNIAGYKQD